jgi:AMP phosphorylase
MRLIVKDMDISTGRAPIVILNENDAARMDLHPNDRLFVTKGSRKAIAVLDIAESEKAVPIGHIGLFEETLSALRARDGDFVDFRMARKPESVVFIRKKLDGRELSDYEINAIVKDIVFNNLTDVELTSFVTANYVKGMSLREIVALTKSMAYSGLHLSLRRKPIMDVHSIGGVPGNRTTPIIVPIVAAAGLTIPKTSSRAITSPAGTADTLEVLTNVVLPKEKLERLAYQVGGFMVWGGAISLAPADDKIIAIEHPLNIDAEGQMLASIMAKKMSVGATHLLLEIPMDVNGKVKDERGALHLKNLFTVLGSKMGIEVTVLITDGSQPVGNGIGPALEARDLLWVLLNDRRGPYDLREKSLIMAGKMLEIGGKAKLGEGYMMAQQILDSGQAFAKFAEMIKAQGGPRILRPEDVPLSKLTYEFKALRSGRVIAIDNHAIAHIAKSAGAPSDRGSGLLLNKHRNDSVKAGDVLYTVYANTRDAMNEAMASIKHHSGVFIK